MVVRAAGGRQAALVHGGSLQRRCWARLPHARASKRLLPASAVSMLNARRIEAEAACPDFKDLEAEGVRLDIILTCVRVRQAGPGCQGGTPARLPPAAALPSRLV